MSELYNDLIVQVRQRKSIIETERAELRERDDKLKNEEYRIQRMERLLTADVTSPKVKDARRKRAGRKTTTTARKQQMSEASAVRALRALEPVFAQFADGTHFTLRQVVGEKNKVHQLQKAISWGRDNGYIRLLGREGGKRGGGGNLFQVIAVPQEEKEKVLHAVH